MLAVTRLTDYAVVVLAHLAQLPDRQLYSAQSLAASCHLEVPTVSKLLKLLQQASLLESVRGAQGGYRLARDGQAISIREVIEAIEGPFGMTECSSSPGSCSLENSCRLKTGWRLIDHKIHQLLDGITLADMLRPMPDNWQPASLQQPTKQQAIS